MKHKLLSTAAVMLLVLLAWSCTAPDDETASGPQPADARHSLSITIAPKPAFIEAAITMPDGKNSTNTRAVQTEKETKWEQGDVVWLNVAFRDAGGNQNAFYSALKYAGSTWRCLTEDEADEFGLKTFGNVPFNRTLIYCNPDGSGKYTDVEIYACYTGNGKPDKDGIITFPSPDSGATVPVMEANHDSADFSQPLTLSFTYCCSRLCIPAGYGLEMANYRYREKYQVGGSLPGLTSSTDLRLPAADGDRDLFLLPVADDRATPAPVTLTLNGSAIVTFTPQRTVVADNFTDYYSQSYTLPALGNGSVTPGGM